MTEERTGFMGGANVLSVTQPDLPARTVERASGALLRYRIMAFVTGFVLVAGTVALILKATTSLHMEPLTGRLWLAHGWFYLIYVIITAALGVKLRWGLARYAVVMLAGTIPTMSFVAEHFVTRATRNAAKTDAAGAGAADQPVPVRD